MSVDIRRIKDFGVKEWKKLFGKGTHADPYIEPAIMVGEDGESLGVDSVTGALETVDYAHHEIHSGSHYYISGYIELSDTDTHYVKLVTPNTTTWSHFMFDIKSSGICVSTFDEGASGGMTGGAAVVPINNNRNSANTSGVVITSGVTVATTYVTRLENDKWGASGFKETIGGGSSRDDELILKQNTTYLRSFTSGADNNIIQFKASWYEHG